MLSKKVLFLMLLILIIPTVLIENLKAADEERQSIVEANINIEFETATSLKIHANMYVYELMVFDKTYNNIELHDIATSSNHSDAETLGAIKLTLRNLLKNQIKNSFENATVVSTIEKPSYKSSYFYDEYKVNLTSAFFILNDTINAQDLISGVLDLDAIVNYTFNLQAEYGWNNTYIFTLPESIKYRYTTGIVNLGKISWTVKNREGISPESIAELALQYVGPSSTFKTSEEIQIDFILDASNINLIDLRTKIKLNTIDIKSYEVVPDFISQLDYLSSDGLRLFIENGLLSLKEVYNKTINPIESLCRSTIKNSSFNQTLEMSFAWDPDTSTNCSTPYSTTNMDAIPPLVAESVNKNIRITICGISNRAFFGLINSGGRSNVSYSDINFGDDLNKIGLDYNIIFQLPKNITLNKNSSYSWNESHPITGEFTSDISPNYLGEDIEAYVEIDINKMDLDIPSFFTGKTKLTTTSHIFEETYMKVIKFPPEFVISEKINLPYLNSDAFRLCTEENVFPSESIDAFLGNKKIIFDARMSNILDNLNINGKINKDVFYNSLTWDGDVFNMDDINPIKASIYSNNIFSIPFNVSFWPPNISISNQGYTLKGIGEHPITYRIIFPKGISVESTVVLNRTIVQGETNDDRAFIELSFLKDDTESEIIECRLSASVLYMVGLFVPCILSFILVIILIIVVFFIRKKRRGRKIKKEEHDPSGYEDQEYYVPPPPSSR